MQWENSLKQSDTTEHKVQLEEHKEDHIFDWRGTPLNSC